MGQTTLLDEVLSYPGVLDEPKEHSVFRDGGHGQKVDMDEIPATDILFDRILSALQERISANYDSRPYYFVGVANGANRLSTGLAQRMRGRAVGFQSEKVPNPDDNEKTIIRLQQPSRRALEILLPKPVLILEDVGTTGSSSMQLVRELHEMGAEDVSVLHFLQRNAQLRYLEEAGVAYDSIYSRNLPTYSREECETLPDGFCRRGYDLREYGVKN